MGLQGYEMLFLFRRLTWWSSTRRQPIPRRFRVATSPGWSCQDKKALA